MATLKEKDILEIIRSLAKSQGFYGRVLNALENLDPKDYDEAIAILESQNFSDAVDLILWFET